MTGRGSTNPDACLCDNNVVPLAICQTITMGVSVIWFPKPLKHTWSAYPLQSRNNHSHRHPSQLVE